MRKSHRGRFLSDFRQSPGRSLLQLICVIISLLPASLTSQGCSTNPMNEREPQDQAGQLMEPATGQVRIRIKKDAGSTIMRTDLFAFPASADGKLECHSHFEDSQDTHILELTEGEKTIVAIINSPYIFNDKAIAKLESLEQLEISFEDDNPSHPVMSGVSSAYANADEIMDAGITVKSLMSSIVLSEVSNNLLEYTRLENPRAYLRNLNPKAELLRSSGFHPSGDIEEGEAVPLPCDVGFYTQYPEAELWCYPNETPEDHLGTPRTELVFECEIRDTTRTFTIPLPPIERASRHCVSLTVDEAGEYSWNIIE